ncbi:MAG TPA: hypothetical protein PK233_05895 [Candidatus Atribacteria bacterium]|nr:hypothetical protein [Candidatus Atribacteria bacterium]
MNNQDGEGASAGKIIPRIVVIFTLSLISSQGGRRCGESVLKTAIGEKRPPITPKK